MWEKGKYYTKKGIYIEKRHKYELDGHWKVKKRHAIEIKGQIYEVKEQKLREKAK